MALASYAISCEKSEAVSKQSYDAMYGTVEAECKACDGEGRIERSSSAWARAVTSIVEVCTECDGRGWIKCDTPMENGSLKCPFSYCYCEAARERQQEAKGEWG